METLIQPPKKRSQIVHKTQKPAWQISLLTGVATQAQHKQARLGAGWQPKSVVCANSPHRTASSPMVEIPTQQETPSLGQVTDNHNTVDKKYKGVFTNPVDQDWRIVVLAQH